MVWVAQESFASGELSPAVYGLVSSQQFRSGCQTLQNALLTSTGAVRKRYGAGDGCHEQRYQASSDPGWKAAVANLA